MIDEVDQDAKVDQCQRDSHGRTEVRHELMRWVRDGQQRQNCVHERRHEDTQAHLSAGVADEIAQHARTELLRSELQHQNGDRKHYAGDGDGCRGNGDQDLASNVRPTRGDPGGERQIGGGGLDVELVGDHEQAHAEHH